MLYLHEVASSCFSLNSAKAIHQPYEQRIAQPADAPNLFNPRRRFRWIAALYIVWKKCVELIERGLSRRIKRQIITIHIFSSYFSSWHFESATSRVTNDMIFRHARSKMSAAKTFGRQMKRSNGQARISVDFSAAREWAVVASGLLFLIGPADASCWQALPSGVFIHATRRRSAFLVHTGRVRAQLPWLLLAANVPRDPYAQFSRSRFSDLEVDLLWASKLDKFGTYVNIARVSTLEWYTRIFDERRYKCPFLTSFVISLYYCEVVFVLRRKFGRLYTCRKK